MGSLSKRLWLAVALGCLGGTLCLGCGPVQYLSTVSVDATKLVSEAKTANARMLAPYEYWSAVTYLHMAREKAGEADFEVSVDYGRRAIAMARKAIELAARRREQGPSARPIMPDADGRDEEAPPSVKVVPTVPARTK
jgi:hypothetical protein